MGKVEERLDELGIQIPDVPTPVGSYKPASASGNLIFVSGQLPIAGGKLLYTGKLGADLSVERGKDAARVCSINAIAVMRNELGSLSRIKGIIKLTGYVASSPGFHSQADVVNGASDLFYQVFGDGGRHARAAVGVSELPLNAPVEIEVVAEITAES